MATLAFLAAGGESDPEPGVQSSTAAGGRAEEEAGVATELDIYWKEHMSSYSFGCQHKQTTSPQKCPDDSTLKMYSLQLGNYSERWQVTQTANIHNF